MSNNVSCCRRNHAAVDHVVYTHRIQYGAAAVHYYTLNNSRWYFLPICCPFFVFLRFWLYTHVSEKQTGPLRLIWHNFTNSQR